MEKRALIAIGMSALILVVWFWLFPPPKRQAPPEQPAETTAPLERTEAPEERRREEPPPREDETASAEEPEAEETLESITAESEERIEIDTGVARVVLTNHGARALSWQLTDPTYAAADGQGLELLPSHVQDEHWYLAVEVDDAWVMGELNQALYRVERERLRADGETPAGERVTFSWSDGRDLSATKTLEFREGSYLVDVGFEVIDRGRPLPAKLALGPGFAAQVRADGRSNYYYQSQAVFNARGQVTRIRQSKLGPEQAAAGNIRWAGLEDQYFAALMVPLANETRIQWRAEELTPIPTAGAEPSDDDPKPLNEAIFSVEIPPEGARLYVGPKKYSLLRAQGYDLQESVWFSSYGWLRPIVKYLFLAMLWIHDNVTGNYGLAIMLATFVLRILLFPVNQYSMVKMKKSQLQMQRLQPKIKAIKAKYKKAKDAQSRAKMNQETMELYRKEGINPMGGLSGCLPLLAQFPILIGFYNMLTVAVELRGAPFFGWIQDLSLKDPLYITPILMGITMFAQQKMAMSKIKDPQQLQQQRIMLFMPFMFTFICIQMPSGLVLYWFVNNVLGIGQQWLVNRHTGRLEGPEPKKSKPKEKPKAKAKA